MKSKSQLYKEEHTPSLQFSATVGGEHTLANTQISINLKRGPFFAIGDISLSRERWWATVSANMPDEYYEVIRSGIEIGYIVHSKEKILQVDRPSGVLEAWEKILDHDGKSDRTVKAFQSLIARGTDRGYPLAEVGRHLLKRERLGRNRDEVIQLLEQVLMYVEKEPYYSDYDVQDDEEGKKEVTITTNPDGTTSLGDESLPTPPLGHVGGASAASDVLDSVLDL